MPTLSRFCSTASFLILLHSLLAGPVRAEVYDWANFAGRPGGIGNVDGTGSDARFREPGSVAVDSNGNVFVVDMLNYTIRKVTPAGEVTTVAGSPGNRGSTDGTGSAARFNGPKGIAIDGSGNLYVADDVDHTIRKVTPAGKVTTWAGTAGSSGGSNGTGSAARFFGPCSVTVDGSGNVYVADGRNHAVRKITPAGVVTTLAGSVGSSGFANGTGGTARFNRPESVTVDSSGNVFVVDSLNYVIRKVTPSGVVTTLAGNAGSTGYVEGTGNVARFSSQIRGLTVDSTDHLYLADSLNHAVRKITPSGEVSTLASGGSNFSYARDVAVDSSGTVYVADKAFQLIRRVTPGGSVSTLAGTAWSIGSTNGTGTAARFYEPEGIAIDSSGIVYVANTLDSNIRKITPAGEVTTLAGSAGQEGSIDGTGSAARFQYPEALALDSSGNVYVADTGNHTIRKITPAGEVTTLAGSAGNAGNSDGTGSAARFNKPQGLAVDSGGNLYVADAVNHTIRKVTSAGVVTTMAGAAGLSGNTNGTGAVARFNMPQHLALDGSGNLYVADEQNHSIRKVTPAGVVTTFAGSSGILGSNDGTGSAARFQEPRGVAVDGSGNLFVADTGNHSIRRITPAGVVTTIGGRARLATNVDEVGTLSRFSSPFGIVVNSSGTLYVVDKHNNRVSRGTPGATPHLPTLTTTVAAGITFQSAVTGGSVTSDGGENVSERGVVYGVAPLPTVETASKVTSGAGSGSYVSNLTGLAPSTTYYIRAYATNSGGTGYGPEIQFTTLATLPSVTTAAASSITYHTATTGGEVTSDGGDSVTERGVVYGTKANPTTSTGIKSISGSGSGAFVCNLQMLKPSTKYYARAYAINAIGTSYGAQITFTTAAPPSFQLSLTRSVPSALVATPDVAGTLALAATPASYAGKLSTGSMPQTANVFTTAQVKVTATAKAGHVFSHWDDLPVGAVVDGNIITFPMPEAAEGLTAVFVANPFTATESSPGVPNAFLTMGAKPVFQGLLLPQIGTTASNKTVGQFSATLVPSTGSLSGKVWMDGKITSYTGRMQGNGSVWFKVGTKLSATLPLVNGTVTGKTLTASWTTNGIAVVVNAPAAQMSEGLAKPKLVATPVALLNTVKNRSGVFTKGYFTLALPAKAQTPSKDATTYPQGGGFATLSLTSTGTCTVTTTLADGVKITISTVLVQGTESPIFLQLTTPGAAATVKGGSLSGVLAFDTAALNSDAAGTDWQWFRPVAVTSATKVQAYRAGWPDGIKLDAVAAHYDATKPVQTALGLPVVDVINGNAELEFINGKLPAAVPVTQFNIDGNKVVKIPANNPAFTLTATSTTGLIKGSFTPTWANPATTKPAYQGVLLQKGNNTGGWGFFLSNIKADLAPESGAVTLGVP